MAELLECFMVTAGLDGHGVRRLLVPASTGEHLFHREDLLDVSRRGADSCRRADICGVVYEMVLTNVVDISEQGAPVTGVSDDQYLGFVGIPKPPVRSLPAPCVHFVFFSFLPSFLPALLPVTARLLAAPWCVAVHLAQYLQEHEAHGLLRRQV